MDMHALPAANPTNPREASALPPTAAGMPIIGRTILPNVVKIQQLQGFLSGVQLLKLLLILSVYQHADQQF